MSNRTPHNNAPGRLNPVRVPSSGEIPMQVNTLRPVDSPTLGAASQFANASLQSPRDANASPNLEPLPPGMMPPPPPRPSSLGAAAAEMAAAAASSNGDAAAANKNIPLDRRGSLSPSKRRRDADDDDASTATVAAAAAAAAAVAPPQPSGGDGFAPDEEDGDDDEQPSSPLKRQSRTPAFGQAHALAPDLKAARAKAEAAAAAAAAAATPPQTTVVDVFSPGMLRVPVFRIPSLLTLTNGVCLAFAEARPHLHDSGVIDLVLRRSTDHGRTWMPAKVILEGGMIGAARNATVGNPTAVYDATTKTVWLLLCSNNAADAEWQIHAREGKESRRVWVTSSKDEGKSWARPTEITSSVKLPSWTWYATGPGLGVQCASGRLLVPCNHAEDVAEHHAPYLWERRRSRMVAHCIYSDDHGKTWKIGGVAAKHTNESTLAQLPNGHVVLNARDWSGAFRRCIQISTDEGKTWGPARRDATLVEPEPQGCQGSMLAARKHPEDVKGVRGEPVTAADVGALFFCNPSSDRREMLTVRRSDDGGATWSSALCLEEGPSAYSSMGLTHDGCLGVLYERGGQISFARVPSHPKGPLGRF